jgi:prepilin peptidase CpaA
LFWRGLVGGGDVKLTAAAVLLVGYHALSGFLVAMSLCGLVVTLAVLAADRLAPRPAAVPLGATHDPTPARPTVPYGVAIAASGIVTLVLQSIVTG